MSNDNEKKHVLLLIEDNPLLLRAYKEAFEEKGIAVHVAYDGEVGLRLVRDKKPEIVLLDFSVHGMGGLEVLKKVKQDKDINTIVIVFTMSGDEGVKKEAMKLGADEYLIKSEHSFDEVMRFVVGHFDTTKEKNNIHE